MYSRTQNENGSHNTRCLYCFMTIASSIESEAELDQLEARHICPERALADLRSMDECMGFRCQSAMEALNKLTQ